MALAGYLLRCWESAATFPAFSGVDRWRLLFKKPLNHLVLKTVYVGLLTISTSMLLSLFEDTWPQIAATVNNTIFMAAAAQKTRYHLRGSSFYYFYRDLPGFNFFHFFNALGVAIIFSSTWIISILFLAKISPRYLVGKAYSLFILALKDVLKAKAKVFHFSLWSMLLKKGKKWQGPTNTRE